MSGVLDSGEDQRRGLRRLAEGGSLAKAPKGLKYIGSSEMWWLGDNLPALSALVRYDRLFETRLSVVKDRFLESVKAHYLDEGGRASTLRRPSSPSSDGCLGNQASPLRPPDWLVAHEHSGAAARNWSMNSASANSTCRATWWST
jgi:hypothetical protein